MCTIDTELPKEGVRTTISMTKKVPRHQQALRREVPPHSKCKLLKVSHQRMSIKHRSATDEDRDPFLVAIVPELPLCRVGFPYPFLPIVPSTGQHEALREA